MIACVIGFSGPLFNHQPFGAPVPARNFGIHVILAISAGRQPALTILKRSSTDVARQRVSMSFLNRLQDLFGFERRGWGKGSR